MVGWVGLGWELTQDQLELEMHQPGTWPNLNFDSMQPTWAQTKLRLLCSVRSSWLKEDKGNLVGKGSSFLTTRWLDQNKPTIKLMLWSLEQNKPYKHILQQTKRIFNAFFTLENYTYIANEKRSKNNYPSLNSTKMFVL